jgi:hypothetical protein
MQVADTLSYLSKEMNYNFFREYSLSAFIFNKLIETDAADVFLDKVDLFGCLEAIY